MDQTAIRAQLSAHYHIIEKGLSARHLRLGFGQPVVANLMALVREYRLANYPECCTQYQAACLALKRYGDLHSRAGYALPRGIQVALKEIEPQGVNTSAKAGAKSVSREHLMRVWRGSFEDLAAARCSVRQYSDARVDAEVIRAAVAIARSAPSSCNRQPVHVHLIQNARAIESILEIQMGARSFANEVPSLLLITVNLNAYNSAEERNLPYIDGGIFAMNLMYALCCKGLGSCPLHWAVPYKRDKQLRNVIALPETETVVLLLSVGEPETKFSTAHSQRRPVDEILTVH